jgi:hypothetical protein
MITAGSLVKSGYYFNRDRWDVVAIDGKEGLLPGEEGQQYLQIPMAAALLLAPVAACLCVLLSPLLGFLWLFQRLGRALLKRMKSPPRWFVRIVDPFQRRGQVTAEKAVEKAVESDAPKQEAAKQPEG